MNDILSRRWFEQFRSSVEEQHQALGELDRLAGDGDFGENLVGAVRRAAAAAPDADLQHLADAFLDTGGTSGPLFGLWFSHVAGVVRTGVSGQELAHAVGSGTRAVRRRGGAAPGDRTMVDAMQPAADAAAAAGAGAGAAAAVAAAAVAARAGADATALLLGRRGRASYVGDVARGVQDPGAVTVAVFFEAGLAVLGDVL